jgi:hypothetical protein
LSAVSVSWRLLIWCHTLRQSAMAAMESPPVICRI